MTITIPINSYVVKTDAAAVECDLATLSAAGKYRSPFRCAGIGAANNTAFDADDDKLIVTLYGLPTGFTGNPNPTGKIGSVAGESPAFSNNRLYMEFD